ncbi:MAG: thioredoxin domain-containing protein [Candidatus Caenarcaniphilales bacterium]|nr:thioredoxin domain-containing protein [Candidatus Caenarcaniphilales bacterium]
MLKNKNLKNLLLSFIFVMAASVISGGCGMTVSADDAGKRAQEYLTKHILKDGVKSEISQVKDENGFYTVALKVVKDGEQVDKVKVYVTKDGENLSLGPIFNMKTAPPTAEQAQEEKLKDIPKKDKPSIELFVMSGCPFGLQAEAGFLPVMKLLGDKVDFTPRYVIFSNYQGGGPEYCLDKENKFCSMHGVVEAQEDVRQICIWNEQKPKWWDYIEKFNKDCQIDSKTTECSKKVASAVGVDFAKVESCVKSKGNALLATEVERNKKFDVAGSPTIIINDTLYEGGRSPNNILTAICNGFNTKPAECNQKIAGGDEAQAAQGGCGT